MFSILGETEASVVATDLHNVFTRLACYTRIAREYPALRRWYIGNRLRVLTLPMETALRRDGVSAPPRSISFRPTFLCNAHCKMCSYANSIEPEVQRPITRRQDALDPDVAYHLVDAIAPSHTMLNITGGEPLIWGDALFALLDYCRQRGVATSVTTNGTLLTRYLDDLLASPPDVLVVSLLGPGETHNEIVGLPAFEAVTGALEEILARKQGDICHAPLLVTNTAMLPENAERFAEITAISNRLGAIAANFQPVWIATETMHQQQEALDGVYDRRFTSEHQVALGQVDTRVIWQEMQRVYQLSVASGLPVNFYPKLSKKDLDTYYHHPEKPLGRSRALCAHLFSQVNPDGSVVPCHGHTVGNLYEQDFREIWNGTAMRAFRRKLDNARIFPICNRCCYFWRTN